MLRIPVFGPFSLLCSWADYAGLADKLMVKLSFHIERMGGGGGRGENTPLYV